MNGEQTLNYNAAQCIHTASQFGKETIYNICNGNVTQIPWGGVDWFTAIFLCSLGVLFLVTIAAFIWWFIFGPPL